MDGKKIIWAIFAFVVVFAIGFGAGFATNGWINSGAAQRLVDISSDLEKSNKEHERILGEERRRNSELEKQLEKSRELNRRLREEIERSLVGVGELEDLNKKQRTLIGEIESTSDAVTAGIKQLEKQLGPSDNRRLGTGGHRWLHYWSAQ